MDRKNTKFTNFESAEGVISGYASVFNVIDEHNDSIKLGAFQKINKSKIKLLWQHKAEEPIGIIEEIYEDDHGLYFKAKLLLELPQGKYAYNLIKAKAISGVSIGFKPVSYYYKGDTRIIEDVDLWEISLVTFPANMEANILEIKNQQNLGETMKQQAWENFKSINEEILKSIEQKGSVDPLLSQQLIRIGDYLDDHKSRLDIIETSMSRPFSGGYSSISSQDHEHKQAFNSYLRSGNEQNLSKIEQKSLSTTSDADGGFLITRQTSKDIAQILEENSSIRQLASHEQISSSSLDIIEDYEKSQAGWVAETKLREDTDTPKINKRNIPVFELYAQPAATQKLIDDSFVDIEKWLADKLVASFSNLENKAFITGDGVNAPRGILTYADDKDWGKVQQIKSNSGTEFGADTLLDLYFSLKEQYARNASFLMNRSTIHSVRALKDKTSGRYLWTPSLALGTPDTLLGIPVYESADMPEIGKDKLSIAIADFKAAYKVVDRSGIRILRDPYTFKPFVKFYATKRVGGDIINFDAIKLLKFIA